MTVCLGLSVFQTTSDAYAETVRSATKRASTTTTSSRRAESQPVKSSRSAVRQTQQKVSSRTSTTSSNIKSRTTTVQSAKNVTKRATVPSRNAAQTKIVNAISSRSSANKNNRQRATRVKELNVEKMEAIKSADYSQCKNVYYECMDEFCANKDANLKRCACSSRIHEFDNIKKQLDKAEDKMLDFNQQLLTVSLDKEDAAAINVASEGELGYNTKDRSKSEKTLKKISKSLNSVGDSKIDDDMSALSWSLDIESAWDDVDSLYGVATTSKNGLDLYNAARPICVEMAKEVCSEDELKIAQDGYKLFIQQDCTTVAKSYSKLQDQAIEKIHESNALLDMARLDAYDQRNSDDTITCKRKILEKLSDTSVCGEELHKCLDMTGEYIDPSTGKAFLSENLYNLSNLIQEPTNGEKWSKVPQNEKFVNFLKSKKRFLTTATEQCRDIADTIWNEFLDDAISQIKLAQKSKMEEIRRGCTQLVAECSTSASEDLSEFDSRALSVFNVMADKTVNEMCSKATKSCSALMDVDAANTWSYGMSGISRDTTYNSIIDTCTQVGRDCIIQKCNGTSGNFALCTNINSDNRMAILKRDACWTEVLNCVRSADKENLAKMNKGILATAPTQQNPPEGFDPEDPETRRQAYYESLYSGYNQRNKDVFCTGLTDQALTDCLFNNIPKFCTSAGGSLTGTDLIACLIAEQIWGNCETENNTNAITTQSIADTLNNNGTIQAILSNQILIPNTGSTLLSWFASNTGTESKITSCNTYRCPAGYKMDSRGQCQSLINITADDDCAVVNDKKYLVNVIVNSLNSLTNHCVSGVHDVFGHCCFDEHKSNGICVPNSNVNALRLMTATCNTDDNYYCPQNDWRQIHIYCMTTNEYINYQNEEYICDNGFWMLIDQYGNYFKMQQSSSCIGGNCTGPTNAPSMTYCPQCNDCSSTPPSCPLPDCVYDHDGTSWSFGSCTEITEPVPKNHEFIIKYQ